MIENKKSPVDFNTPIPNLMGSTEEVYYVDTPQGPAFLGDGLSIDPETGAISSSGGGVSVTPLGAYIYSLADLGNGTLLAGGGDGKIYRSENNGSVWDTGTSVGYSDSVMYSLVPGGGNNAVAGTWDYTYPFISSDKGQSWADGEDFDESAIDALGFAGGTTVYAGTYGYIHRSDDGGQTWFQSTSPYSDDYYMCFAFPGVNKVVAGTYESGSIAYSSDGGLNWDYTSGEILDGATWIRTLASDNNGKVIAGTDDNGKVFLSEDSGETWDGGTELGDATKVLAVTYGDGVFYAGTDDNGKIYRSVDYGANWTLFYDPQSINAVVNSLMFSSSGKVVAAINNFIVKIPASFVTPDYPPYSCNTGVNTAGVTNFSNAWESCGFTTFPDTIDTSSGTNFYNAWYDCESLTAFPQLDVSRGTNFGYAWDYCTSLTSFPALDFSSGKNFTYTWGYTGLTSFPEIDASSGLNFYGTWCGCYYLTDFPELDLGKGEDFTYAWYDCESLTAFPQLNVSQGTSFYYAWYGCTSLTSFPLLDVSSGTDFNGAWYGCTSLTSFPLLDVSSGTSFYNAWVGCTSLTSFPLLDVSSGTRFNYAWYGCTSLTSFPLLDVSSGTDFNGAWYGCTSLTSFPLLDVSSGTNFYSAWNSTGLTSFPALDVSSGTYFGYAWVNCASLTSFPLLDVSSGTDFNGAWYNCFSLTSFPLLDVSSGTSFYSAWYNCASLTSFPAGMFDSCSTNNNQAFRFAWQNCALNQTSVDNILVSLDTSGIVNNYVNIDGGTSAAPSGPGATAKTSLQAKGWTVLTN